MKVPLVVEELYEFNFLVRPRRQSDMQAVYGCVLNHAGGVTARVGPQGKWQLTVGLARMDDALALIGDLNALRVRGRPALDGPIEEMESRLRPVTLFAPVLKNPDADGKRLSLYQGAQLQQLVSDLKSETNCMVSSEPATGLWRDEHGNIVADDSHALSVDLADSPGVMEEVIRFVMGLFDDPECDQTSFYVSGFGRAYLVYRPMASATAQNAESDAANE